MESSHFSDSSAQSHLEFQLQPSPNVMVPMMGFSITRSQKTGNTRFPKREEKSQGKTTISIFNQFIIKFIPKPAGDVYEWFSHWKEKNEWNMWTPFYGIDMNGEWNLISFFIFFFLPLAVLTILSCAPSCELDENRVLRWIRDRVGYTQEAQHRNEMKTKFKNAVKWVTGKQQ